jgi:hypothetical protein
MARTADVLHDVWIERRKQDIKWGGAEHDDQLSMDEWRQLIRDRTERVPLTQQDDRRLLIETAAIAVAAIQALDRRPLWEQPAVAGDI